MTYALCFSMTVKKYSNGIIKESDMTKLNLNIVVPLKKIVCNKVADFN